MIENISDWYSCFKMVNGANDTASELSVHTVRSGFSKFRASNFILEDGESSGRRRCFISTIIFYKTIQHHKSEMFSLIFHRNTIEVGSVKINIGQ